ncbi:hypothetical protein QR680_012915 [Steinernema hermaphroditum]|uniref:Uncharacterized protein n=1 Tax=Steinernema hermaphroditum TaxID=289476 RepID=A0AA39I6A6_9BILA|nr:hypothetical protein QR680_012915 [Steinernema hermaphroditum]
MRRTLLRCAGSTAKCLVFLLHLLLLAGVALLFRLCEGSVWRPFLLVLVLLVCFSSCSFGLFFGSVDCRKTKVEVRRSRTPLVFTVDLPIENALRRPPAPLSADRLPSYAETLKTSFGVGVV